jgi:hypothetical protein
MINEIFVRLAEEPGRNTKIEILKEHQDNELLKRVIFLALDPFTQFYIRKIPEYTHAADNQADSLDSVISSLEVLSSRAVTGNAAIEFLVKLLSSLRADDALVLERVISKDLKCGVSESTVNKVWPNLIHEYPCMLASAFDQKLVDKVTFPAYVQLKSDGMRFNAIVKNGNVEFRSRSGKEIQIADPLFEQPFITLAKSYGIDMVFDGELLCVDETGRVLDRKTGNGILNKAVKGTQSKEEGSQVRATIWDAIPIDAFHRGVYNIPYDDRLIRLEQAMGDLQSKSSCAHLITMTPTHSVNNMREVQKWFDKYLAEGQEGIILKTQDMIWEDKRSKKQIKFKGELECDLKVVDWIEGTGKHVNRMGSLILESGDGKVKVGVGTGFSDSDRDSITRNDIGRIVAVKYNARINDKRTDVDSLFLPVFIEFREDKTVADSSKDIK